MRMITVAEDRDGCVPDDGRSATRVAWIVGPGAAPGDTVGWPRAHGKKVV